jgi:uncharacterized protein
MTPEEFLTAIQKGQLDAVRQALADQPGLAATRTAQGLSGVLLAFYVGQPAIAHLLAAQRDDLSIFEAAALDDVARLQTLLETDPALANAFSIDGFQPLGLAAFFGSRNAAEFLVHSGAEINSSSHNGQHVMPLHSAAAANQLEIARLLLAHGADPNARQGGDFVPLHSAAQNGQLEIATLLLDYGAVPGVRESNGSTALDYATKGGHTAVVELLRARGV